MKVKTSDLEGAALDWAVAQATKAWDWAHSLHPTMTLDPSFESACIRPYPRGEFGSSLETCVLIPRNPMRQDPSPFCPSSEWSHGGPLISDYRVSVIYSDEDSDPCAWTDDTAAWSGPTPLIAAMRAIVAAKLGDEIEIPMEPQS